MHVVDVCMRVCVCIPTHACTRINTRMWSKQICRCVAVYMSDELNRFISRQVDKRHVKTEQCVIVCEYTYTYIYICAYVYSMYTHACTDTAHFM